MDNPEKRATQDSHLEDNEKQKPDAICVRHNYAQANTNNVDKAWNLQTTGCKGEPNIVFYAEIHGTQNVMTGTREVPASYKTPAVLLIYTVKSGKLT